MSNYRIWVNGEEMYLTPNEVSVLKIYKGSENLDDLKNIGVDIQPYEIIDSEKFNNKGINYFCMFLENPSYELASKIGTFSHIRIIINEIKTLIDVMCKYGLQEGPMHNKIYRYEDNKSIVSPTGLLNSFKSFSKIEGGVKHFKRDGRTLIETSLIGCYPHFYMEQIPFGNIEGESEILLPPYIKYKLDSNILSFEGDDMLCMDVCCMPEKVISDEETYEKSIQVLEKIGTIDNEQVFQDVKPMIKTISNSIKKYAFDKYADFINKCNTKYANTSSSYLMHNSMEYENYKNSSKTTANLKKGQFGSQNDAYYVEFIYPSRESQEYMLSIFNKLVLDFGGSALWVREHKNCIMPYLIDENGNYTYKSELAKGIGGTNIPNELLDYLIKKFVEECNCIITCNDMVMEENFNKDIYVQMINGLNNKKVL